MDGKTVAIAVLVATALGLGGVAAHGLRPEPAAYAQDGVYSTYLAATAQIREDLVQFVILDTATRRLIFYEYNPTDKQLVPADGRELLRDFGRKVP